MDAGKKRGRPRSQEGEDRILETTRRLLTQTGYDALTVEGVAAAAGAGKQTIYRRWKSKSELAAAALLSHASTEIPLRDSGDLETDLTDYLQRTFGALVETGDTLRILMARAQLDDTLREAVDRQFLSKRRATLAALIRRSGKDLGKRDQEAVVDMIYGAMWYRLLAGHGALDATAARRFARLAAAIR